MGYEDTLAAFRRGDNDEAAKRAKVDLDQATAAGDIAGQVDALCMLARVALRDGRLDEVDDRASQAERIATDAADRRMQRMPLHLQAVAARMAGRHDKARELYGRSIALNDELGDVRWAAAEHRNLAYVEVRAGAPDRARELFEEASRRLADVDYPALAPYLMFDQATVAALDGDNTGAAAKLAVADKIFDEQGVVPDPDDAAEIADLRRRLESSPRP